LAKVLFSVRKQPSFTPMLTYHAEARFGIGAGSVGDIPPLHCLQRQHPSIAVHTIRILSTKQNQLLPHTVVPKCEKGTASFTFRYSFVMINIKQKNEMGMEVTA
jgi:hypothetical protein